MLPAIITDVIYDVIWFALPIFLATSPGIWIDKSMVILLSAIPLIPILVALFKKKQITQLPTILYNHYWKPTEPERDRTYQPSMQRATPKLLRVTLPTLALVGASLWIYFTPFSSPTTPITISRNQAVSIAREKLENSINVNEWTVLSRLENPLDQLGKNNLRRQHIFAWQTAGLQVYSNLNGSFLLPPAWRVRFVKFSGTLEERAEEYQVMILGNGSIARVKHVIPEETKLESLSKKQAIQLIDKSKLGIFEEPYSLVSAKEKKQPHRIDWIVTYSTPSENLGDGQKRFRSTVSGTSITDAFRYIFVPEEWQRTFNNEQQLHAILQSIFLMIFRLLLALCLLIILVRRKGYLKFSIKNAGIVALVLVVRVIIQTSNMWPQYNSSFLTSQPYGHQVFSLFNAIAVTVIFKILICALFAGLVFSCIFKHRRSSLKKLLLTGISVGALTAGINVFLIWIGPHQIPSLPDLLTSGASIPSLSYAMYILQECIEATLVGLLFIWIVEKFDGSNLKQQATVMTLFIIAALSLTMQSIESVQFSMLSGIVLGIVGYICYEYIARTSQAAIPFAVATFYLFLAIQQSIMNDLLNTPMTILGVFICLGAWALWSSRMIDDVDTIRPQEGG